MRNETDMDYIKQAVIAAACYTRYCKAVGGKAFNGDPLPDWETFAADPKKSVQLAGWLAVGDELVNLLEAGA